MNVFYRFVIVWLIGLCTLQAAQISATISTTDGDSKSLGEVVFTDSANGLLITPNLSGLPAGLHGFHLHQHPDCGDKGMDAGGHFDPAKTNSHQGPYGNGHLGDLPVLYVTADGKANTPTLAPRLKLSDLKGLTVMVHAGGDNYSDTPPLGGGGAREACGVIKD
ncbi:MAG TPA: superoxide dismutase family protein [Legionella sp.]|nr:superoxide dismutase family protein [Legionella sp.]